VNAEANKTIQYLINEPISMLDWGIYQTQRWGSGYFKKHTLTIIKDSLGLKNEEKDILSKLDVYYERDSNLIVFEQTSSVYDANNSFKPERIKTICEKIIKEVKGCKIYLLGNFFHAGDERKIPTESDIEFEKELLNLFKIKISVSFLNTNNFEFDVIRAESMLNGDKIIMFSE